MPVSQAVEDVKKYIPQLNSTHDALLGLIETRARAIIDAHYRLKVGPGWPGFQDWGAPAPAIAYGWGTHELWLPPHQIGSITAINNMTVTTTGLEPTTPVVPANWLEDEGTGVLIWPSYIWGEGYPFQVTGVWGYGPMPDYVYQVLLELMINIWRAKDRSQTQEGVPLTFDAKLTEAQKETLSAVYLPWQAKVGTIKVYRATF